MWKYQHPNSTLAGTVTMGFEDQLGASYALGCLGLSRNEGVGMEFAKI